VTPRKLNLSRQPANLFHPEHWRIAGDDVARPRSGEIRKRSSENRTLRRVRVKGLHNAG
jgi:hypothetical protein